MTGDTIGWRIRIDSAGMTFGAIRNFVSFGQREKIVVYLIGFPVETVCVMAVCAIGGKTDTLVIGTGGSRIIGAVAIDTIISNAVELQTGFGGMAVGASGNSVCADERKAVVVVQLRNIVHQPALRCMAPGTVIPHGSVVHIGVAGDAVGIGICKNHASVTDPAIDPDVLTGKREARFGVAEPRSIRSQLPAGCF